VELAARLAACGVLKSTMKLPVSGPFNTYLARTQGVDKQPRQRPEM
jgi:hypothetical protein